MASAVISFLFLLPVLAMFVSGSVGSQYGPNIPKSETEKPKIEDGYGPNIAKPKAEKPKLEDGYGPNIPKPKAEKPKIEDGYGPPNIPKPKAEKPKIGDGYGPNIPKPKAEKPKTENGYGPMIPKPKTEKPKVGDGYGPNIPKLKTEKPKIEDGYKLPKPISIQGLIYCKSGSKLIPLEGATARITCLALDKDGYESAPLSVLSCPADAKGYFLAILSPAVELLEAWKIKECKAFLENSPLEDCNVPTDFNKGISGAPLYSPRPLNNMDLYSVGPFVYTYETKPTVPNNGY